MQQTIRDDISTHMQDLKAWLAGHEHTDPEEMSAFFEARVSGYEEHMSIWAEAYARVPELVPRSVCSLLDLGCGTGLELDALLGERPELEVTGIDLSSAMLSVLVKKHPQVNALCKDYFSFELGDERYDFALSFESLHHFTAERKLGLYQRVYRALKQGGGFLLADYIACCEEEERLLFEYAQKLRRDNAIAPETFIHFDTPLTLEHELSVLKAAGFSPVEYLGSINGASFIMSRKA